MAPSFAATRMRAKSSLPPNARFSHRHVLGVCSFHARFAITGCQLWRTYPAEGFVLGQQIVCSVSCGIYVNVLILAAFPTCLFSNSFCLLPDAQASCSI
jgi:hypothetical protein